MRRCFVLSLALAVLLTTPPLARAQETGTPVFKAPYRAFTTQEFGVSLSDPGTLIEFAFEGFYRYGSGPHDLSLRGGFADGEGDLKSRVLLGGDLRSQVLHAGETVPLDGALTVGLGASIGEGPDRFYVPVGVSLGRRFLVEGTRLTFVPYFHPVVVPSFGGGGDDVGFALGLGTDFRFTDRWALRISGGLGDIDGIGLSLTTIR